MPRLDLGLFGLRLLLLELSLLLSPLGIAPFPLLPKQAVFLSELARLGLGDPRPLMGLLGLLVADEAHSAASHRHQRTGRDQHYRSPFGARIPLDAGHGKRMLALGRGALLAGLLLGLGTGLLRDGALHGLEPRRLLAFGSLARLSLLLLSPQPLDLGLAGPLLGLEPRLLRGGLGQLALRLLLLDALFLEGHELLERKDD